MTNVAASGGSRDGREGPTPKFLTGSTLRHTLVMTASGSVGLIAVFVVDLLSLLYVSWLDKPAWTAGVGFATQVLFVAMSVNIGLAIAITAMVARALGERRRERAREYAGSGLALVVAAGLLVSAPLLIWREAVLDLFGARGEAHAVASQFLAIALPSNALMALGMALQGLLRAVGDARRAMMVTLLGAVITAAMDPLLIFGLGLGPNGAALSTVLSRVVFVAIGAWGVVRVHGLAAAPGLSSLKRDFLPIAAIAGPVILTNMATPVANSWTTRIFAGFGEDAVAGLAIVDRVTPVAFGVLFALTGAVGPILAQNAGADRYDRVRRALGECFVVTLIYTLCVWAILAVCGGALADLFRAGGQAREIVLFYCRYGVGAWLFLSFLFVANTAFNNLGAAFLATFFNWGRTFLGVGPFVAIGAHFFGVQGAFGGIIVGAGLFGTGAAFAAFALVARLAGARQPPAPPDSAGA